MTFTVVPFCFSNKREERGCFNQIFKDQCQPKFFSFNSRLQMRMKKSNLFQDFLQLLVLPFAFFCFSCFFRPTQREYKSVGKSQKTFAKKNVLLGKYCILALKRAIVGAYMWENDNCS
jgi:hypothetical protein